MKPRISAIATSVYVLVTVMPRYSRSILSSVLQGNPRSGGPGAGAYTENGTQYPGLVYSEVNTLLTIDASGISGAVSPSCRCAIASGVQKKGDPSNTVSRQPGNCSANWMKDFPM